MDFRELQQLIDLETGKILTDAGFQHLSAGTWNRRRCDELNVLKLQEHSEKESFCVNLGVHYTFLPKAGTEAPLGNEPIELPDCELKLRLTNQIGANDQWWPIAASSAGQVADLVRDYGLQVFEHYRIDELVASIDGQSIESGSLGPLVSITKVRACLLLARIHERLGNHDKSIEAATIGLKVAGMAVGPKKALKDLLKRIGQNKMK
jgi:hypothetical protein